MATSSRFTDFSTRLTTFIRGATAPPCGAASLRSKALAAQFEDLAVELFRLQFDHVPDYRLFCERRGVTPANLESWTQIPPVPTTAFKERDLTSLPPQERRTVFHSSGTTGRQPSRHFHDAESLACYEASALPWFRRHLLPEFEPDAPAHWNPPPAPGCVMLTPPPAQAPQSSLVHMFDLVRRHCGGPSSAFVATPSRDGWRVDVEALRRRVEECRRDSRPMVLLGTAFSFVELIDLLSCETSRHPFPAGSRILETGGYKGRSRQVPKAELYDRMREILGVELDHIVSEYGMSELGSQAYDHVAGLPLRAGADRVFRFPPWARSQVVSPETGEEVGDGETGLLRVFDLANVRSVLAIQTEDLAVRRGDGFELVGRAPEAEARGCSLLTAAH